MFLLRNTSVSILLNLLHILKMYFVLYVNFCLIPNVLNCGYL